MGLPRPVLIALGITHIWNAPEGLPLDTAPYVMAFQHGNEANVVVTAKPALAFYQAAINILGTVPNETLVARDDIRDDIEGAQKPELQAVLVRTVTIHSGDLYSQVKPNGLLESATDLPA